MNFIEIDDNKYEIVKNYRNAFSYDYFSERYTDYFKNYDYIVGDIAYGSLRLKGFYNSENKKVNKINDYKNVSSYLSDNCAYDCRYFILKKVS